MMTITGHTNKNLTLLTRPVIFVSGINKNTGTDGYHLPKHHGFDFVGTNLPFTLQGYCDTDKVFDMVPSFEKILRVNLDYNCSLVSTYIH